MKNAPELSGLIAGQIGARDWAEWQSAFDAWDAPWELIRTLDDVCADPQVHANEMIFDLTVGDDHVKVVAGPAGFDGNAAPFDRRGSPGMGEHTDALLAEIGYTPDQLADLKARNKAQ